MIGAAARLARRELRGGVRGFRIFVACLVLGVGAIAGVGSIGAAVDAAIRANASSLLGGDVSVRLAQRRASAAELSHLHAGGRVTDVARLRAMAVSLDGARRTLIDLKAVDAATYPLYGAVALAPEQRLSAALARRGSALGAVMERAAATRLELAVGDRFKIGDAEFVLRATIEHAPDAALTGLVLGPGVLIDHAALAQTGLLRPGALVIHDYRVKLANGADAAAWAKAAREAFPDAGWQIRTAGDATPGLRRFIARIGLFLHLVGITALLVGGIGIAGAVSYYVSGKIETIATLKSLGAPSQVIFLTYAAQIAALAGVAIVAGLILGAAMPAVAAPLLARLLSTPLRLAIYPAPLAVAAASGLLTVVMFALWPLAAGTRMPPGALFRDRVAPMRRRPSPAALVGSVVAAAGLAALVVATAPDRAVAAWYLVGAAAAFAVFRAAGAAIIAATRRLGRPRHSVLRLALANLQRPGGPTARIVLSLGIGLTVLVAVALVEADLTHEIDTTVAEAAPSYFFIDIQPDQIAGFEDMVRALPGARVSQVPMLRGRITRLNGVAVEDAPVAPEAQWALRSDRGLTYAATPPAGSRLVAGAWWPQDYRGPPLVSFDAALAHGMGLGVGDTLTVNVLGRDITATIASLRQIDWTHIGINFAIVFAPGTLEAAPHTHLAAVYLPASEEETLMRAATAKFANVSAIPVRDALAAIEQVIAAIGAAIRLSALVALAAGALVLGGAVAADYRRRLYEAVVLKVLGATRATLAAAFLVEYALMGLVSAVIAGALGTLIAYVLVTRPLDSEWTFVPGPLLILLPLAVVATMALGFAGTWRVLGVAAARHLRSE